MALEEVDGASHLEGAALMQCLELEIHLGVELLTEPARVHDRRRRQDRRHVGGRRSQALGTVVPHIVSNQRDGTSQDTERERQRQQ